MLSKMGHTICMSLPQLARQTKIGGPHPRHSVGCLSVNHTLASAGPHPADALKIISEQGTLSLAPTPVEHASPFRGSHCGKGQLLRVCCTSTWQCSPILANLRRAGPVASTEVATGGGHSTARSASRPPPQTWTGDSPVEKQCAMGAWQQGIGASWVGSPTCNEHAHAPRLPT